MGDTLALPRLAAEVDLLKDTAPARVVFEFYDREHASLVRYLCFLSVDQETAKEIVQDCFVKLHEHLRTGGDSTNLRAWLYRVAHNLARNVQVSAQCRRTDALTSFTVQREPAAADQDTERNLLEAEKMSRLREGMMALPAAQRQALVLRSQGLKYREIAEALGLSTSTVAENIQRGTETLRKTLA